MNPEESAPGNLDHPNPMGNADRTAHDHRGDVSWKAYSNQWNDNQGWPLMAFAGLVFLVGAAIIAFQQNRFKPPAFPSSTSIRNEGLVITDDFLSETSGEEFQSPSGESEQRDGSQETSSGDPVDADSFRLRVVGAAIDGGPLRVAVYDSESNFNQVESADWKHSLPVGEGGVTQAIVPAHNRGNRFAIAVYHDKNDNDQLDRNAFGIPTERYGFSNSARGKLGPPSFEEAAIDRPEAGSTVELEIW